VAIAPGVSAALIASCSADPFAYASTRLDCQSAAGAWPRRDIRVIHIISPAIAAAPSRTHSQTRLLPDEELAGVDAGAAGPAAGAVVGSGVFAAVWVGVAGADSVVAVAAVWVGRLLAALLIALLTLLATVPPHPATRHPAIRTTARKERFFTERRMTILPVPRTAAMDEGP